MGLDTEVPDPVACVICYRPIGVLAPSPTPTSDDAVAQRCTHIVCSVCFSEHLRIAIVDESNGFPCCPVPGCNYAASHKLISAYVDEQIAARMRYLRGTNPTRRENGTRMWCAVPGCYEPLPPPPMTRNGPATCTHCAKCGTRACMRCGCDSCIKGCRLPTGPVASELYKKYAASRMAKCMHCGSQADATAGGSKMKCTRCGRTSKVRAYRMNRDTDASSITSTRSLLPTRLLDRDSPALSEERSEPEQRPRRDSLVSIRSRQDENSTVPNRPRATFGTVRGAPPSRGSSFYRSTTSSPEKPPPSRALVVQSPASFDSNGDEFGILARIDDMRAGRKEHRPVLAEQELDDSPAAARAKRFLSNPTVVGASPLTGERGAPSIFDGDISFSTRRRGTSGQGEKKFSGSIRRLVGRVAERDGGSAFSVRRAAAGTPPVHTQPLRTRRSLDFDSSPVFAAEDGTLTRRRSSYIPATRAARKRMEDYYERKSVAEPCE